MRWNRRVRALLCGVLLQAGVLFGVPMRAEDVESLMHAMHQQRGSKTSPDQPGASKLYSSQWS